MIFNVHENEFCSISYALFRHFTLFLGLIIEEKGRNKDQGCINDLVNYMGETLDIMTSLSTRHLHWGCKAPTLMHSWITLVSAHHRALRLERAASIPPIQPLNRSHLSAPTLRALSKHVSIVGLRVIAESLACASPNHWRRLDCHRLGEHAASQKHHLHLISVRLRKLLTQEFTV